MLQAGFWILSNKEDSFPDPLTFKCKVKGLIALSNFLDIDHIKTAYRKGIFPWFNDPRLVLWWFIDPRMVLQTKNLVVSHSLKKRLKKAIAGLYEDLPIEIKMDSCTREVIENCSMPRDGEAGTWILPQVKDAYSTLADQGIVHSIEVFVNQELMGGLYGVNIGRMFYGESMFSKCTDVSKIALCVLTALCIRENIPWIDCQQDTPHLASLGATALPGAEFIAHLDKFCSQASPDWSKYRNKILNEFCQDLL